MHSAIQYLLERWRLWNFKDNGVPKVPPNPLLKLKAKNGNEISPLSDDEGERVNVALKELKNHYLDAYDAILVRYRDGIFDDRKAGQKLGIGATQLAVKRNIGLAFLAGKLL